MDIKEILQKSRFPEKLINELANYLSPLEIKKNKYFVKYGEKVNRIGILFEGALVSRYSSEEGKEVASKFYFLGGDNIVVDYSGFKNQLGSKEEIQALDDSKLLTLKYSDFYSILDKYPEFGNLISQYAESSYLKALSRIRDFQFLNAKARVQKFILTHRNISSIIPIKDKASYLGISRNVFTQKLKEI